MDQADEKQTQRDSLKNGTKNPKNKNNRKPQVRRNRIEKPKNPIRQWFIDGFESKKFHKTLLAFILLEWVLVSSELLIDLYMTGLKMHKQDTNSTKVQDTELENIDLHLFKDILQYCSFAIQTIFLIEVGIKLFVFRGEFFRKRHELFDSMVIITSFTLSLIFIKHRYLHYTEAIVILRIWNTLRLIHGLLEVEHESETIDEAEEMEHQHQQEEKEDSESIQTTQV